MVNHTDIHEDRGVSSVRDETHSHTEKFGRTMAEGPGLITAILPTILNGGNVRRMTSANTPDYLDRLGSVAPKGQGMDMPFCVKRPPGVKDDNFPPGFNGVLTSEGRRRSAEMAVKLKLHTREFPPRQLPKNKSDDLSKTQETGAEEEEKVKNKKKRGRRAKKKDNTEETEISIFLENRETLTPGLYAKGKPAPALSRKSGKHDKKPEVNDDAQKQVKENKTNETTLARSLPPVASTCDDGVKQLLAEIDKRNAEFETLRKNDPFFNRFNGDATDAKFSDEEVFGEKKKKGGLPPINGNAVSLGKRKAKHNLNKGQTNWDKIERKGTLKDGNVMKLPPISVTNGDKKAMAPGQEMKQKLLTNAGDYWHNEVATTLPDLSPMCVAGLSVEKKRNVPNGGYLGRSSILEPIALVPFAKDHKLNNKLSKKTLPPLTDKSNKKIPQMGNISAVGQPFPQVSRYEPTLPQTLKLPPITGLPLPTTTDVRKHKGKRFA